jgi:hypothetical protein
MINSLVFSLDKSNASLPVCSRHGARRGAAPHNVLERTELLVQPMLEIVLRQRTAHFLHKLHARLLV